MIGLMAGLMLAQPSLDRAMEDLREAKEGATSSMVDIANTRFEVKSASYNNTTSVLNITLENTGSETIEMGQVDLLLNGTFIDGSRLPSGFFYPGQIKNLSLSNITDPRSIKMIGPYGISDSTTNIGAG
ncbi:MAG: hypothetical protein ACMUIE_01485 [Thermoplasmatota archaeon]